MTAVVSIRPGCPAWWPDSLLSFPVRLYWLAMETMDSQKSQAMAMPEADEAADVRRAQGGDDEAFARLVRRHQATIAAQMWRFSRQPREHAELVQDVFVNAWRSLSGYRSRAPFVHWLRKIAVRTGYAFWQARAARSAEVEWDDQESSAPESGDAESAEFAAQAVHAALAALPPRDRVVLTLIYFDGRSLAEVAELLGWSLALVKVQAWRARLKLKKTLGTLEEWS